VSAKKHTLKVSILNEEYSIRSDTPPEHARAVAHYLDKAIRTVMSSGGVVETNRAVVLAALQITAELFEAKNKLEATNDSIEALSEYVRPLLHPTKRQSGNMARIEG
jgi:cell division protein ZapA (FtsZ GTPase activity inhibitor)